MRTASTSLSPVASERLLTVPVGQLHAHPANANLMSEAFKEKLAANIAREGRYPPLIVRPHPSIAGEYELLDGVNRAEALRALGHVDAVCFLWPCDDATALVLLATLNRLEGEDVPGRRAELLGQLQAVLSPEELTFLLPEDASAIAETLALLDLDTDRLLAELSAAAEARSADSPRLVSFALMADDEAIVERALTIAVTGLEGNNRRGRALGLICSAYLDALGG